LRRSTTNSSEPARLSAARRAASRLVAAGVLLLTGGISRPAQGAEPGATVWSGLLVPAYFPPSRTGDWGALADASAQVPLIAIANVFNGPGTEPRADYRQVIDALRRSGGRVLGYVHTSYTRRPLEAVASDVRNWGQWYEIDGIFVDEMTNDGAAAGVEYYRALRLEARARNRRWMVAGNPGTTTRETYLLAPAADMLVTFENRTGYDAYLRDTWTRRYEARRFAHLLYAISAPAGMEAALDLSRRRGAAWIYVTDDDLPNPWDRLPAYWAAEVGAVREANREVPLELRLSRQDAGSLLVMLTSLPGAHRIQSSRDLLTWTDWYATVVGDEPLQLRVPVEDLEARFLRAVR